MPALPRLLLLVGSPRRDGNSSALAAALARGAEASGTHVTTRLLDDHLTAFLRDCRTCRRPDGECAIADGFRPLFFDDYLPADGVIFCSPIYWYGLSAQTKAFLDRTFCYYAASSPCSAEVIAGMTGKRLGLALAAEETYPGAALGIVHQIQEFTRYTRGSFVGVVRGTGNRRGEIARDPADPLAAAEALGRTFFTRAYSDHHLDTPRAGTVWP